MIDQFTQWLNDWIVSLPPEAILLVPLLAFLESCLVIGVFVSGVFLLGTVSLLYAQGNVGLAPLVALAFAGAMTGDHLGYFVGYKGGPYLWKKRWVRRALIKRKDAYRKSRALIAKSAPWAVCVGRLSPPIRSFSPVLVGMSGVKPRAFFGYDLLACTLWSIGLSVLAYSANQV